MKLVTSSSISLFLDREMSRRNHIIERRGSRPSLGRAMPLSHTSDSDGLVDTSDDDSPSESRPSLDRVRPPLYTPDSDDLVDTCDSKAAPDNEDSGEFNDASDDDDGAAQTSGKLVFVHLV